MPSISHSDQLFLPGFRIRAITTATLMAQSNNDCCCSYYYFTIRVLRTVLAIRIAITAETTPTFLNIDVSNGGDTASTCTKTASGNHQSEVSHIHHSLGLNAGRGDK